MHAVHIGARQWGQTSFRTGKHSAKQVHADQLLCVKQLPDGVIKQCLQLGSRGFQFRNVQIAV